MRSRRSSGAFADSPPDEGSVPLANEPPEVSVLNAHSGSLVSGIILTSPRSDMSTETPRRRIDAAYADLQARAAAFVDEVLIPFEVTAELAGGPLPLPD